jgi:magnesium-transporting ATPase (P-type)
MITDPRPPTVAPGLTSDEAARRFARDGANELPPAPHRLEIFKFLAELVHFFALMLWAAAILAWTADLPQLSIAIVAVVVINAVFAFAQERRSDRAAERLKALMPRQVTVRRDGHPVEIAAREVVVGDVLLLGAGDRISADADVVVNHGMRLDTSMLTGESESMSVSVGEPIHAGTFVVDGEAEAEVRRVGAATRLAQISSLTITTKRPKRPLTNELNRVVRAISVISIGVGLLFMLVSLLLGTSGADAIVFAIGVTVALVPEGLLPTVTLSLAIGGQRMAHRNALVRHLDAVETLGSTTFICTDKTGTLTQNRMAVNSLWTPTCEMALDGEGYGPSATITMVRGHDRSAIEELVKAAARCGTGRALQRDGVWQAVGDPMEAALDACARRVSVDLDSDRSNHPELKRFPFDSDRKRMSIVIANGDGADLTVLVKGAVESVLSLCGNGSTIQAASDEAEHYAALGRRVLAVASRSMDPSDLTDTTAGTERGLELLGLVALEDPPRPAARDALDRCRAAGIKVAMITGDHPRTALAIARDVDLAIAGSPVLVGRDLPHDLDELAALIDHDGVVISRASPEDKLRIAQALRRRGHVVAMTGDGVNDGPALRAASIGVAMGRSGTDVAREAADVVLLDDDFATIVEAVAHGRATFLNVRRFLTYHLTDNVAELTPFVVWALSGGRIPLALGVMQILALDIGTDTTSATALGAEAPSAHVLDGPPVSGRLLNHSVAWRAFGLLGPTEAFFAMASFFVALIAGGWSPGEAFPDGTPLYAASGAAFLAVVLGQKANAWACRSATLPPWRLGWLGNRLLCVAATGEMIFALVCLVVVPIADVLDQRFPPWQGVAAAALAIPAVWLVDLGYKRHRWHRAMPRPRASPACED